MSVSLVAHLGHQVSPSGDMHVLSGFLVQPIHPFGQRQLLAAQMAFLVLAAGPTPARLVAAQVAARLDPMRLQQHHQRVVRPGACATQQPQPALDITAIGSDASQVDQRQRPVRIHRLGRQQFALGLLDVADSLECHRAQPPPRHPRGAWHPGLHRLGEQAQCGRATAVGVDSLGHQQLGQQRVDERGPELSCHTVRPQSVLRGFRRPRPRRPPRSAAATPGRTTRPAR